MSKKTIAVLSLIASLLVLPLSAQAHPPKDIELSYDASTQKLTITISHSTMSAAMHYIKRVDVKKNGKRVESYYYKYQPDNSPFSYTYTVPAAVGDVIEASALCNLYGNKTVKITVGKDSTK